MTNADLMFRYRRDQTHVPPLAPRLPVLCGDVSARYCFLLFLFLMFPFVSVFLVFLVFLVLKDVL